MDLPFFLSHGFFPFWFLNFVFFLFSLKRYIGLGFVSVIYFLCKHMTISHCQGNVLLLGLDKQN